MNAVDETRFAEVLLDRVKIASQQRISKAVLDTGTMRTMLDVIADQLAVEFSAYVLGFAGEIRWRLEHREPATWWDALKAEHAPAWYVRRHPIRETFYCRTIEFDGRLIWPGHNLALPKGLGPSLLVPFPL